MWIPGKSDYTDVVLHKYIHNKRAIFFFGITNNGLHKYSWSEVSLYFWLSTYVRGSTDIVNIVRLILKLILWMAVEGGFLNFFFFSAFGVSVGVSEECEWVQRQELNCLEITARLIILIPHYIILTFYWLLFHSHPTKHFSDALYKKSFNVACRTHHEVWCVITYCAEWQHFRFLWWLDRWS